MLINSKADVLCAHGVLEAEAAVFSRLSDWLAENESRHLVLFDEAPQFSLCPLLAHPRVRLLEPKVEVFQQVAWEFLFLTFDYFNATQNHSGEAILAQMAHIQSGVHLVASDYSDRGEKVLRNLFANLAHLPRARRAEELYGAFEGTPAIICGAGPSFAKNCHALKALDQRALIFGGGSALNVLSRFGIVPHFGASIDPDPPYDRFSQHTLFEVPFFYQNRVAQALLNLVHAPLLWVSDSGGYPLERKMNEELGLSALPFDGGWNVATFCLALSYEMGCNPIILVGMDLCSQKGASPQHLYAPGVGEDKSEGLIETQDEEGNTVYSKRDWLMAKQWIEMFIEEHPDRLYINATEGGVGFKNARRLTLDDAALNYLQGDESDLRAKVHAVLQRLSPIDGASIAAYLERLKESFERCAELCVQQIACMEKYYPAFSKEELTPLQLALEKEKVYQEFLHPLWEVWKHVMLRNTPQEQEGAQFLHRLLFFKQTLEMDRVNDTL